MIKGTVRVLEAESWKSDDRVRLGPGRRWVSDEDRWRAWIRSKTRFLS